MPLSRSCRAFAILATALACLLPAAGCGGGKKKKSGLTIAQRLEKALAEKVPENQARELVKVARLQARSSDTSGASKTLSTARGLLSPKPRRAPAPDAAPATDSAPPAAEPPSAEEPADGKATAEDGKATPAADDSAAPPAAEDAAPDAAADAAPAPEEQQAPAEPETVINPTLAGPTLVEIGAVYALIGERGTAKDVLTQARKLLPQIDDQIIKARMLAEAGGVYGAKTGGLSDVSNARRVLTEAAAISEGIEERFRPESLAAVAMGYVTAGLAKDASATVANLETLARAAENRPKAEGLAVAATVRGQTGDKDAAKELLAEATAAAKAIDSPENRAYALVSVAMAMSGTGDRKGALAVLREAEKSALKVGDADAQKNAAEKVRAAQADVEKKK